MAMEPAHVGTYPRPAGRTGHSRWGNHRSRRGPACLSIQSFSELDVPAGCLVAMVFCRVVFRKTWLVAVVFTFFGTSTCLVGSSGDLSAQLLSGLVFSGAVACLLLYSGFLPGAVSFLVYNILVRMPLRLDASGWSARGAVFTLTIVSIVALYGFYTSLGGRPVFGGIYQGG
jgi:hypothetical protein